MTNDERNAIAEEVGTMTTTYTVSVCEQQRIRDAAQAKMNRIAKAIDKINEGEN
jgi:hypothetical protein